MTSALQYIKYGILDHKTFLQDLHNWEHLYVAGRLQKPVQHMQDTLQDTPTSQALHENLHSALTAGLLLSPKGTRLKVSDVKHQLL
jgi:translocator assembly and maintenance protein 41